MTVSVWSLKTSDSSKFFCFDIYLIKYSQKKVDAFCDAALKTGFQKDVKICKFDHRNGQKSISTTKLAVDC